MKFSHTNPRIGTSLFRFEVTTAHEVGETLSQDFLDHAFEWCHAFVGPGGVREYGRPPERGWVWYACYSYLDRKRECYFGFLNERDLTLFKAMMA